MDLFRLLPLLARLLPLLALVLPSFLALFCLTLICPGFAVWQVYIPRIYGFRLHRDDKQDSKRIPPHGWDLSTRSLLLAWEAPACNWDLGSNMEISLVEDQNWVYYVGWESESSEQGSWARQLFLALVYEIEAAVLCARVWDRGRCGRDCSLRSFWS